MKNKFVGILAVIFVFIAVMSASIPSMAEESLVGDLDGNGAVNKDDAVYLLMNIFFSEDYPITQNVDFTDDGKTDKDDAVHLLMHVFFPDDYSIIICDHVWIIDEAVDPMCTESGLTEGKHCDVCGVVRIAQDSIEATGHTEVTDIAVEATCTIDGKTEGKHCDICGEVLVVQTTVDALGHTEVVDAAVNPTCTETGVTEGKHCSVCFEVLISQEEVAASGHVEMLVSEGLDATCVKWGVSDEVICKVCNIALTEQLFLKPRKHQYVDGICVKCQKRQVDYTDPALYVSNEGYIYFETQQNGEAMRRFYDELDEVLTNFHLDTTIDCSLYNNDFYYVTITNYKKYGLTLSEALKAWTLYRKDHPLFYWMSYYVTYTNKEIVTRTVPEYASGKVREQYNALVYSGIEYYTSLAEEETSAYNIALVYYENIMKNNKYAYESDGKTYEDAQWAHSILGAFEKNSFVCEGYAKLFQLLLNFSGVENIYVVGDANGSHTWNMVRMDNGEWYWFDVTWDDTSSSKTYRYFCVTDGSLKTHTPYPESYSDFYANMPLPNRAITPFSSDDILELYEQVEIDGNTYMLSEYGVLRLVDIKNPSNIPIYDLIVYNGVVYNVVQ